MRLYSDDFKANIVKLYHDEKSSRQSLANKYGVHPTTISHWIK
ncbi:transposase [Lentilactobacillus hilgardii]|nr:transposase [Lentilactobacillus hilgardii]